MTRAVGHGTYEHDCDVGQVTWLSPSSWDFDMYNCQHLLPAQRVHINVNREKRQMTRTSGSVTVLAAFRSAISHLKWPRLQYEFSFPICRQLSATWVIRIALGVFLWLAYEMTTLAATVPQAKGGGREPALSTRRSLSWKTATS